MAIALSLLQPIDMCADDWPQWRGPNRDGVWRESGIFDAIPVSGLQVGWRARIGAGYSGPVVAQGRVFVTDHQFDPEVERVVCFEEVTGQQLWVHSYSTDYKEIRLDGSALWSGLLRPRCTWLIRSPPTPRDRRLLGC